MNKEIFEILIDSKYAEIALIITISGVLIKLILVIWKIIKENRIILSVINDNNLEQLTIDKKGSIFIKKKLKNQKTRKS
ncbi:hypothetical protein GCM10011531_12810 [Aquaticitalea lipolytica]|jgi:hypothetical protein|uniref:Uncharacterized protein n=1 Tax=Aquaticitalea lipolytica TaxID=1247562 RepID=A0A8J2TR55_9FLAO|nr:hypothetical protein [Aquaticitalea lipolytica]GFZ83462.1 hypothetical protein GCM10011531_12810 [Aquaticitalea lipolytica]